MTSKLKILDGFASVCFGSRGPLRGFVFGEKNKNALIVLQEWWGITEDIQNQAKHLSKGNNGYRCLIPDFYKGKLALDEEEANHLMQNLNFAEAVEDIGEAAEYLKKEGSQNVGVIGFCMGGALAASAATKHSDLLNCAIVFYGTPDMQLFPPANTLIPVQCHFGENDPIRGFSDKETAQRYFDELRKSKVSSSVECYTYDKASHAFMNSSTEMIRKKTDMGFGDHNQQAVTLSWRRVFNFLAKHM